MTNKLRELKQKRERILKLGGEDKIKKQHDSKKLTCRERIEYLLDPGSFNEIDMFVEHRCQEFDMKDTFVPCDGVVTGYGTINGRKVFVYAQDFTSIGGSLGEMHAKKICKVLDLALKYGCPVIGINDSGGARIQEGVDALAGYGEIFYRNTMASGVIPQIAAIMGPCAGGAVYSPAIMDFIFMVDKTSQMFVTGPQVIKAVTGEEISFEELGGAYTHSSKSGVAHFIAEDEYHLLDMIKYLLSFIPSNNMEDPPFIMSSDSEKRFVPELENIIPQEPNKAYDVKEIIYKVVDNQEFLEVQPYFAQNAVVGFGRIGGFSVGIVANQPKVNAGVLDYDSSDKIARFVRFCDAFNIPIITFTDVPGFLPGVNQEHNGIIRHGAKVLYAYSEATVPKINVILRKAYGGAYIAMSSKHIGADFVFAWPTAEIAVMGPDGAANIIFRKEIQSAQNPEEERKRRIEEYTQKFANPYIAAARGYVDDVIEPQLTRNKIIEALKISITKREQRPPKKHGNIPL
ncbi:acetyl-CoA carboxylase carboxyltransferase component [Caldicellulosiruptor bescii]|uniref:Carboxyl transferase n=3 Tax=Caldicellulosiruptor TaxID=44000 RepID=B9MRW2_CALBD|nr:MULTISPECIES: carboxyl transferase domain-containing protein [Caldicellulosiruptor]ACM60416.1 carboxyl transferase [Caldicellulosiruptor bescii DSM 6725]ADQ46241.1 carboxyl transferase [Caldicellulosiruptor kronotskyensis 2002]PBC87830.1 acetyl-CoA carboxylase carboxyltransferase component [Caldicellulosiruptor bescii]PBC90762.1 acetyl-CoA carboxylase carboxyltransferase component [Caldicellulosiruptor bescii]PBD03805.1 acetyl-CoA carboxylase carboxyltransferase component [Caldicellulosirup